MITQNIQPVREKTDIKEIEEHFEKLKSKGTCFRKITDDCILRLNALKPNIKEANMQLINNKIASRYEELKYNLIKLERKKYQFLKQVLTFGEQEGLRFEYEWSVTKSKISIIVIEKETNKVLHVSHIKTFGIPKITDNRKIALQIANHIGDTQLKNEIIGKFINNNSSLY